MNKELFNNMRDQMEPDAATVNTLRKKINAALEPKTLPVMLKFFPLITSACVAAAAVIILAPILINNPNEVIPQNSGSQTALSEPQVIQSVNGFDSTGNQIEYFTYEEFIIYADYQKNIYQGMLGQIAYEFYNSDGTVISVNFEPISDTSEYKVIEWTQEYIDRLCNDLDVLAENIKNGSLLFAKFNIEYNTQANETREFDESKDGVLADYSKYGFEMRSDIEFEPGYFDAQKAYYIYNGKRVNYFFDYKKIGSYCSSFYFYEPSGLGEVCLWVERDENWNFIAVHEIGEQEFLLAKESWENALDDMPPSVYFNVENAKSERKRILSDITSAVQLTEPKNYNRFYGDDDEADQYMEKVNKELSCSGTYQVIGDDFFFIAMPEDEDQFSDCFEYYNGNLNLINSLIIPYAEMLNDLTAVGLEIDVNGNHYCLSWADNNYIVFTLQTALTNGNRYTAFLLADGKTLRLITDPLTGKPFTCETTANFRLVFDGMFVDDALNNETGYIYELDCENATISVTEVYIGDKSVIKAAFPDAAG